ncbi:MAG: hypothetical protein ACRCSF_12170 [Mycobacteriaceae bacterium]
MLDLRSYWWGFDVPLLSEVTAKRVFDFGQSLQGVEGRSFEGVLSDSRRWFSLVYDKATVLVWHRAVTTLLDKEIREGVRCEEHQQVHTEARYIYENQLEDLSDWLEIARYPDASDQVTLTYLWSEKNRVIDTGRWTVDFLRLDEANAQVIARFIEKDLGLTCYLLDPRAWTAERIMWEGVRGIYVQIAERALALPSTSFHDRVVLEAMLDRMKVWLVAAEPYRIPGADEFSWDET